MSQNLKCSSAEDQAAILNDFVGSYDIFHHAISLQQDPGANFYEVGNHINA